MRRNVQLEKIAAFFLEKMWTVIGASARDAQLLLQSSPAFFEEMKKRREACPRAWLFGIAVATGLSVLGLPASRSAGVVPSFEFVGVMTMANWLLILFYGACFGLAARLSGARKGMLLSINAFFYLAGWLVFLKLFEMPALGVRLKVMAQNCTAAGYGEAVSSTIQTSSMAVLSNFFVLIGYAVFIFLMFRLQRLVHEFGRIRALFATTVGVLFLSAAVSYVQGPVISQLLCAYASPT